MKVQVVRRAAVLSVAVMLALSGVAGAQVLEQFPQGAMGGMRIGNLGKVSTKIADYSKKLGLDQMSPEASDPMGVLEQKLGIKGGVNRDGDFGVAFLYATGGRPVSDEPDIVMLIPISDYKAFLANFPDAKTEGDVSEVTTEEDARVFVKAWGAKHAALSPRKDLLALKPEPVKITGAVATQQLNEKDIVLFGNMDAIRSKVLPMIKENRQKWIADLERNITAPPRRAAVDPDADPNDPAAVDENAAKQQEMAKRFLPAIKAAANQGITMAEAFVRDATSATYSLNLTDAGIDGTIAADMVADSYAGKLLSSIKGTDASLLTGLPAGKYLFLGGSAIDPKSITPAINDLLDPILKELAGANDPQTKSVVQVLETAKRLAAATTGQTAGMMAPTGQLMQDAIIQTVQITRGDAAAITAATKEALDAQQQLMALFQGQAIEGELPKTVFTPAARQVDGVTFDAFKTELPMDPNNPEAAQAQQMLSILYGPEGMSGLIGKIDDKQVLAASGLTPAALSSAIKSAKTNDEAVGNTPALKLAKDQLPKNRVAAFYIPLDVIIGTGLNYAQQFGMPVQVQLAQDLPPVGMTLATEGPAIRMDGHLPTPLVADIVKAVRQVWMPQGGGPVQAPADGM